MRIGFDAKRLFHNNTGLGNYSRNLIRLLSVNNSWDLLLYNPKPRSILFKKTTTIERLPDKYIWKKLSTLWRIFFINRQIRKDKLNLYHGLSGELPLGIGKLNVKTITTIHDLIFLRFPQLYNFIDRIIYIKKMRYACEKSDAIIAISEQTKTDIIKFFKIDESKITVIYQGCDPIYKKRLSEDVITTTLRKYKLPKNYILNVGTIEERKNTLSILRAIKDKPITLVIAGKKTNYVELLKSYAKKTNNTNKVIFIHNATKEELRVLYQSATIFVYPSLFEGFGVPIIEAMFSGTPVITSTGSCFKETAGEHSLFCDSKDIDTLKKHICKLWNNESYRQSQIQKGYIFVKKFEDEVVYKKHKNLYNKVLKDV